MKRLLLSVSLVIAGTAFSQTFSENFESVTTPALPAGWTQVTNATDGGYITTTDYTSQYFGFPAHTTYAGTNDDVCNCDKSNEQLISPAITLPAGASVLSFEYILGQYYGEFADVAVSTNGGTTWTNVGTTLAPTNGSGSHVWTVWSTDLSAYAGQTINIAWIYDDNAGWGSGLMIDDVTVFTPAAVDMEMSSLSIAPVVAAGNVNIAGTVTSLGASNITSIDISWNDGSGANNQTFPVNLNYGDTYNFTHGTPLVAVGGNDYNVTVTVTATSDANNGNDALTSLVSAVTQVVPKVVVGEEKTGEWCGWCPRGAVAMAEMAISNPNDFIGIAVHNGDPMAFAAYDGSIGNYIPGGYPGAGVDRVIDGDPSTFSTMHASRVNMIPPASISVVANLNGTTLTADVTADFVGSLNGDYRLAAVVLEDDVTGTQANYYDDGNAGAMQMPNGGSMPNFNFVGGGSTVNPFYHDHVARALGSNQINGAAGSLPASISAGQQLTHTYTFNNTSAWDMANVHVVGMLVNAATGEILNAGKAGITGINDLSTTNFNVNVAPNPTNGVANVIVDLDEASELDIVVVDVLGNVVYQLGSTDLAAGSFSVAMDLSNEANGVYFAKVSVNDTVKTVKINVAK